MNDKTDNLSPLSGETEYLMPRQSKYAGQAIDVSCRRSIEVYGNTSLDARDKHCVIDYFYHEGEYWRAVIPLDGVAQVCGQAFNFSKPKTRRGENGTEVLFNKQGLPRRTIPTLNHVQSRFTFLPDQPVELYPLGCEQFEEPTHRVHDIIYSLEVVGPTGAGFNLKDGLLGNLMSAHRFLSIQEMVFERLVVESQYVTESPPLPLQEDEKRKLLIESILRAHRAGMSERYYLYRICGTNNCTSSPFQIVDRVLTYSWLQRIGSILYRLPLHPRFYLRVRGLDSDPSYRKLVRSEYEAYIDDPKTQQRKRDHVRNLILRKREARKTQA